MLSSPTSVRVACLFSKPNGAHNNMPTKEGLKGNVRLDPHEDLDNTDGISPSGGVSSSMRRSRCGSATPKATRLSFLCFFHAPAKPCKNILFRILTILHKFLSCKLSLGRGTKTRPSPHCPLSGVQRQGSHQ